MGNVNLLINKLRKVKLWKIQEGAKYIFYNLHFIDRARFMATSWSNLVNNPSEGIHRIKCKHGHGDKKCETWEIKYKYSGFVLEYIKFKNNLIKYKCQCSHNNHQHKFDEKLMEWFFNTQKFCNHDNNKSMLLLRKCVYPYEYIDDWKKCNETSSPEKEVFYSHLDMEDINYAD